MDTSSLMAAFDDGCEAASPQGYAIALFGAPKQVSGTYGATRWGAADATLATIEAQAKQFIAGADACTAGYQKIGIGTSNNDLGYSGTWLRDHGEAWAEMINSLYSWTNTNHPTMSVYGALNLEDWSQDNYNDSNEWMHGYDYDAPNDRPLLVMASLGGCPTTPNDPNHDSYSNSCSWSWTQWRYYHLVWWHSPAMPIPENYNESSTQAKQWRVLADYSAHAGKGVMTMFSVMSQWEACEQQGGCSGTKNTPTAALNQMTTQFNGHATTTNRVTPIVADIRWDD